MKFGLRFPSILITIILLSMAAVSQTATVIAENANLRGTPSSTGKVVVVLAQNSDVEIMKQSGAWFLVQAPAFAGWLHGNTIRMQGSANSSTLEAAPVYVLSSKRPLTQRNVQTMLDKRDSY